MGETVAWDGCLKYRVSVHILINWVFYAVLCGIEYAVELYKIKLEKRWTVRLKYTEGTTQYLFFNHVFGQIANIFFSPFSFLLYFSLFKNGFEIT